jgi:PiT family inorganic phosphate transporter
MIILLFLVALFLAYSNGANLNFKGVAILFGSKTTLLENHVLAVNYQTGSQIGNSPFYNYFYL